MKKREGKFLIISFALIVVVCVVIFMFLANYMNHASQQTISTVGTAYMSGMNSRISKHFETTMELRLLNLENVIKAVPEDDSKDHETVSGELTYNAEARSFDYLSLYAEDGSFEMIYGEKVSLVDPEPFLDSIRNGERKVAVGYDDTGLDVVLIGIPAAYPMEDGSRSAALVAGLPVDYVKKLLDLDEENRMVYSHVTRRDGSFVIRSRDQEIGDNYFNYLAEVVDDGMGKTGQVYVQELCDAINKHEDYSSVLYVDGERRHLYCTALPYSEWYLITVMPYGVLDETVNGLSRQWIEMLLLSCGFILAALTFIFIVYFKMTNRQLFELEKARQEAVQATKAKSEFLSNMSHDIRTPMNAIVGMTAIATANMNDRQQVQNCLKKITLSSKHLLGLINDVLDMSKIESGKMTLNMEMVSLREVMDNIVSIVQPQVKTKKQHFNVSIHNLITEDIYCDSVRFNQILLNLLSNAIKFTPEGGSIGMSLYQEESPLGENYVRVHLNVTDTGIGMSEEFRKKVFESFVREDNLRVHKTEGSGLGMTITKYIVDAMGGTIEVKSELKKGSDFRVTLDFEKALIREEEMILPDWDMLVVDDDEQLCQSAVAALKEIGIQAEWVMDGETALSMVKERHEMNRDYHIILLDWKLPGIDGIETARKIRKDMGNDVPILLISAYDWGEIEEEAREAGINGFIAKPLFKSTLFHGLKQYVTVEDEIAEVSGGEAEMDFTGRHILLAEDNDLNWEIAEALLSALGMELERAENGQICVDMFSQSEEGYYEAILMDIRMPIMTGYEAAKAIRALDRPDADLPIVAMTADAFSEDIQKCIDCGMNAHVAKPIDVKEVVKQLKKFMKH